MSGSGDSDPATLAAKPVKMRPSRAPELGSLRGYRKKGAVRRTRKVLGGSAKSAQSSVFVRRVWTSICLLAFVTAALTLLLKMRRGGGEAPAEEVFRGSTSEPILDWVGPLPQEIAERFTAELPLAERMELVRDPEGVGPLMERFFTEGEGSREVVKELRPLGMFQTTNESYDAFEVTFEDGSQRFLCVLMTPKGGRVDFKCYARYGSASWEDLREGKVADVAEMRVMVQRGNYYMGEYDDDELWTHFVASWTGRDETIDLYAVKGSAEEKELLLVTRRGIASATIGIRYREDVGNVAGKRQFEATKFLWMGWIEPEGITTN